MQNKLQSAQRGFTLVEIAIVLVIIGLLIGGVLKGQELINSAKVKNYAADFRNIPLFIYGYQDKFRAIPGDDAGVTQHISGSTLASTGCGTGSCAGNGQLDGDWDSSTITDESYLFWQHIRLAGLAGGSTDITSTEYRPRNADGGFLGIESASSAYIDNLPGAYVICSSNIAGKLARQLDITIDDGNPQSGSLRIVNGDHTRGDGALSAGNIVESTPYTVCVGV